MTAVMDFLIVTLMTSPSLHAFDVNLFISDTFPGESSRKLSIYHVPPSSLSERLRFPIEFGACNAGVIQRFLPGRKLYVLGFCRADREIKGW